MPTRDFGRDDLEGNGERYLNQAHRDDIAAALFHLVAIVPKAQIGSGIFNVCDDEPITQREAYGWLAYTLSLPLPPVTTRPAERKRGGSNKRVSNRTLRELGWTPKYPTFALGMDHSVLPSLATLGA